MYYIYIDMLEFSVGIMGAQSRTPQNTHSNHSVTYRRDVQEVLRRPLIGAPDAESPSLPKAV